MYSLSVRSIFRLGMGLLAPVILATALAGPMCADALDPNQIQVQYLPRDGAAIVFWNGVENATEYYVYQQEVTKAASPSSETTATAAVRVKTDAPITTHSLLVENLTNGTPYHFSVSAIVDGKETDPVGPTPHQDQGLLVSVVPQKPVKLTGIDGFYGYNIGTDLPGSHTVDDKGAITLKASGWDIQSEADGMYYLAVPVKGDITVTVRTVSGPTETPNQSTWNLGGPQIRESLDAGSRLAMTQVAHEGAAQFKRRTDYAASPQQTNDDGDPTRRPLWLRVVRKGDDFSGFLSDDGTTFTQLDDPVTIDNFAKEAYVGLSLASHDDGEYSTVVFDNFTITSP